MSCPPQSGDDRAALSLAPLFPQPGSPGVISKPVAHIPGCLLALESLFMHYCLPSRLLLTGGEGLHLGDTGVELVARSLMGTFRVVEVDLSRNEIGPAGATALSTSLQHNDTLECLGLSRNRIEDEGCGAVVALSRTG